MRSTRRVFASAIWIVAAGGLFGCGGPGGRFASGSYERGNAEFDDESYIEAIDDLKLFIRRNPTDERADDAQMMISRAYMAREDYPVAAVELEILRKDYPTSPLFDDAYYLQGVCYAEQVPRIELAQTVASDAIQHFEHYLRDLPQGTHKDEASKQLLSLNLHLDEKLMAAARHYAKVKQWDAASIYLRSFLAERLQSSLIPDALYLLATAELKTDEDAAAKAHLEELLARFPEHPLAARARSDLGQFQTSGDES